MFNNSIIGMIHTLPLPGSHRFNDNLQEIIDTAVKEAKIYLENGLDAIIIENMHDTPYLRYKVNAETVAALSVICTEIKKVVGDKMKIGLQILAGANFDALAVAKVANLDFIRAEGFSYAHFADEGLIESCAAELLRYRKNLSADNIHIYADIKKKHSSHAITNDLSIEDIAHGTEFMEADGMIVTGMSTGSAPDISEINRVKEHTRLPVLLGSGITEENISFFYNSSDAYIIGSYFKKDGFWKNCVDENRVKSFMMKVKGLKEK